MNAAAMVPQTGLKGSGVFIAVVGPSGAGKDTLIAAARGTFAGNPAIRFPRRVVTRPADPTLEIHDSASEADFAALEARGGFVATWRAHGHAYGIPAGVADDIAQGQVVIMNVSRGLIGALRHRFPTVHVAYVTASPDVLAFRLRARGRENDAEIERRVARASRFDLPDPPVTRIDNSGALADAVDAFVALVSTYAPVTA